MLLSAVLALLLLEVLLALIVLGMAMVAALVVMLVVVPVMVLGCRNFGHSAALLGQTFFLAVDFRQPLQILLIPMSNIESFSSN